MTRVCGRAERDTEHVDLEVVTHLFGIGVGQRSDGREHAGVVHPEVDGPEPFGDVVHEPLERMRVGHVELGRDRVGALGHPAGGCVRTEPEAHPPRGERSGQARAEAAAGPGHDCDRAGGSLMRSRSRCGHGSVETKTFFTSL